MAKLGDIKKLLDQLVSGMQSQTMLKKLGLIGVRTIQKRTREGVDVDGRAFQPYSEKYAEKRILAGLPTHIVNLEFDDVDGMLQQVEHIVASDLKSVHIDITDPQKKKLASYHDELGVAKAGENIRHFWGLSDDEQKDIGDIVAADLNDLLSDLVDKYN